VGERTRGRHYWDLRDKKEGGRMMQIILESVGR